jgi:hypothetical protein
MPPPCTGGKHLYNSATEPPSEVQWGGGDGGDGMLSVLMPT